MSGHPAYAWGCAPRPPNAQAAAGYGLDFSATAEKSIRTAPQIRSQGACGAFYFWRSKDQIKNQPYKRRLAPDPGGRRPSGRGVPARRGLGVYPKSLLNWGPRKVVRPCGERRAHRSGEGCPNQGVGSARLKRRLRPTRRSKSATPAVAVQFMHFQKAPQRRQARRN